MSSEDAKPVNCSAIAEKTPVSQSSIYIGAAEKLCFSPIPHFPIPFKQDLVLACINISDSIVKFA